MPFNPNTFKSADVQSLLENYQAGTPLLEKEDIPDIGTVDENQTPEEKPKRSLYRDSMFMPIRRGVAESNIDEALSEGFGTSRYDDDFYSGMDLENSRALAQSGFSKIGTGLGKMATTAVTTALNTTLGTVFGVGSAMFELAADADGDGRGFMDTIDAGVNNWLSGQFMKLQDWSEDVMPNYRTAQERSEQYQREWWKHMGTANFIGDSILKNFGFTIGAVGGGFVWSKLLGSAMSKKIANDVLKGAVAASEGDAVANENLHRAIDALRRGTAVGINADQLAVNIQEAARRINSMSERLKFFGAAIGAMGEGTVEGLMAKNEMLEEYEAEEMKRFQDEYENLENDILRSGNKYWVQKRVVEQPNGELVEVPYLTENGKIHLMNLQRLSTQEHESRIRLAREQADRLASTTFLLNLPILTASNAIQFGRMLSGGWRTNRALARVAGGIEKNAAGIAGKYSAVGNKWGRTILNSLKVAGTESFEEMAQGTVSSGAKRVAENSISAYNDGGYDDEAINSVRNWFSQMIGGGKDYLADIKNWQEGALGALTGLFGLPGRRWNGGVVEAYREANDETKASRAAADKLNALVNSKEFQNKWHNYIRHLKYDNQMREALVHDDEYTWHEADDNQLINDVMTFADAGRLEDLNQVISYYGNITTADAQKLKEAMSNGGDASQDWTKNASPEQIVDKVKKQADKMKTVIQEYKDIYDDLSARAPIGTSPELLKELVFTALQLKAFDRRFLTMFGEVMQGIDPILRARTMVDSEGKRVSDETAAERFKVARDNYERLFAGSLLPVAVPAALQKRIDADLDAMQEIAGMRANNQEQKKLGDKIADMRKLSSDRKEFYRKLQTLQSSNAEKKFQDAAVTNEKVEKAAEKANAVIQTSGLDTFDAVRKAYLEKDATGRAEFMQNLSAVEDSNPHAKEFLKLMRRIDGFRGFVEKDISKYASAAAVSPNAITRAINMFVNKARNEEHLINLPDDMFITFDEFSRDNKTIFGAASPAMFAAMKQQLRNAMDAYLSLEGGTATRNSLSPTPVAPQPAPGTVSKPTGYDAAQPASLQPEPAAPAPQPQPAPQPEPESEPEPVIEKPSSEKLVVEAMEAVPAEIAPETNSEKIVEGNDSGMITFYRTGIPEIVPEEADKARNAIRNGDRDTLKQANLSDYGEMKPAYADVFNALKQRDAFKNTSEIELNDRIEFIVDPKFPTYDGKYQILMTTIKNGERKVLSVLSGRTSQYFGLRELRDAIDAEYRSFIAEHPNEVFVFSKSSRVWGKRPGLIDYDFEHADDYSEDRGIINIPGYDDRAPIVYINRHGEAVVVRGSDKNAASKVSDTFDDVDTNVDGEKRGNLYYLAKSPNGRFEYIPIRLWVEHFRKENMDSEFPVFTRIKNVLGKIAGIVQQTNEANLDEQNGKLREQLQELAKDLNIRDDFFRLGKYPNVGVALRYSTPADEEGILRRPDQMTEDWMVNFVAGLNRSIQIRQDAEGNLSNLNELIDTKIITSNAKMLRPKGVDFYITPWIPERNDFGAYTVAQQEAEQTGKETPVSEPAPESAQDELPDDIEFDRDDFGEFLPEGDLVDDGRDEGQALTNEQVAELLKGRNTGDNVSMYVREPFVELPLNYQVAIQNKGYTAEEYDDMSEALKEKVLRCLGV